jgi:hypothetical protein
MCAAKKPIYNPTRDALQYLNHPEAEFVGIAPCLQGVTVRQYLAKGAYGAVYLVDYKGEECVMKIVVGRAVIRKSNSKSKKGSPTRYNLRETKFTEFANEVEQLKQAGKLGIAPQLIHHTTCFVQLPRYWGNQTVQIGIMFIERLHRTLYSLFEEYWRTLDGLAKIVETYDADYNEAVKSAHTGTAPALKKWLDAAKREYNKRYAQYRNHIQEIEKQVVKHCETARAKKLYILDVHSGNVMLDNKGKVFISDWGITWDKDEYGCLAIDLLKEWDEGYGPVAGPVVPYTLTPPHNLVVKKAPKGVPQKAPKGVPQKAPKGVPQKAPKGVPQKAPKGVPQKAPKGVPQKVSTPKFVLAGTPTFDPIQPIGMQGKKAYDPFDPHNFILLS